MTKINTRFAGWVNIPTSGLGSRRFILAMEIVSIKIKNKNN